MTLAPHELFACKLLRGTDAVRVILVYLTMVSVAGLFALALPARAGETSLQEGEIVTALTDKAVTGNYNGEPYVQTFHKDGLTIYSQGRSISKGLWQVRNGQFCSQWPPAKDWTCYRVTGEGDHLTFVGDDGKVWPVTVLP